MLQTCLQDSCFQTICHATEVLLGGNRAYLTCIFPTDSHAKDSQQPNNYIPDFSVKLPHGPDNRDFQIHSGGDFCELCLPQFD